ncbi:MAG TPA: GtrA family protein [Acidimicrobiales bacterium]|jgi:putative flippase GtrA|nr:GtrA family protein [Acidimicrobiales bacterium]
MRRRLDTVLTWSRTDGGRKWVRYSMVSVISVIISQVLLAFFFGILHWSARSANVWAVCLSAIPSYYLNRAWAWGKRSRSHLLKEVIPFWGMALIGLLLSTWAAGFAEARATAATDSRLVATMIVNAASIGAFGVLWVGKFVILNKLMFGHHPEDLPAALDGRSGIPT